VLADRREHRAIVDALAPAITRLEGKEDARSLVALRASIGVAYLQLQEFDAGITAIDRAIAAVGEIERVQKVRAEIRRIESNLQRLNDMAKQERYASTEYLGRARMIDLSAKPEGGSLALAGRRVLVVDDDVSVRESVSEILRADGAGVTLVGNGREAIERMRRERFDVVLSDVVMPEMDGYELFQAARREAPDTPVVLMTAFYYDQDHVIKRSRMEGLDGVLFKKPVNPERLVKTLAELITRARPRPS